MYVSCFQVDGAVEWFKPGWVWRMEDFEIFDVFVGGMWDGLRVTRSEGGG